MRRCDLNIELFDDQSLIGIDAVAEAQLMARLKGRDHVVNNLVRRPGEHQRLFCSGITQGKVDPDLRRLRVGVSTIALAT